VGLLMMNKGEAIAGKGKWPRTEGNLDMKSPD